MELTTISEISRGLNISTRTLRYYEQIGLISSTRKDGYAYRVYDEGAVSRLRQIVVLRKLRIPLNQITQLLQSTNTETLIDALRRNLSEVDDEIGALGTIREILASFIDRLSESAQLDVTLSLLEDSAVLEAVDALTVTRQRLDRPGAAELEQASAALGKITDRDVRIIYLPPSDVAAYQYDGDDPELHVHQVMDKFVRDSGLTRIKPDLRHFGFNSPNTYDETGAHGYEVWVTVPDGFELPAPLARKHMDGGLYAAHMIPMGAFEEWELFSTWAFNNDKYEYRGDGNYDNMFGFLEEGLNYINRVASATGDSAQLDLLIPIREKAGA
ncbi:MAG: effector binding domain-containing protein [Oscillospiraceae bacterium]|jgi:DNA-binding transcriptional MerR regulator|nr:effector binding domain-containing protein [Oscillospiraceae bacterium]